ncbi:MAG: class I SAM-dependent methyltransferase [Cryobacterium sp.]|nr:class I SAM-dependent methyltransferase [Oligoflexia bacterium]
MENRGLAADLKYQLYEATVQSPEWQVKNMPLFHKKFTGQIGTSMREDFSGTGRISCDWAKKSKSNRAVGLDLDPEPLDFGERMHRSRLKPEIRSRVTFIQQDVLVPTREKFDMIGAHNFSFFIFLDRETLLKYAKAAFRSLNKRGTFFLEMAGGDGFIKPGSSEEKITVPGVGKIRYSWEQHQYDSVANTNDYSIHFKLPDGRWMNDEFRYHWRLWQIREVREILSEAGFKRTEVLWPRDEKSGRYDAVETGEHCDVWLAYVVGVK